MIDEDIKKLVDAYNLQMTWLDSMNPTARTVFPAYQLITKGTNEYQLGTVDYIQYDLKSLIWHPFPQGCQTLLEAMVKAKSLLTQYRKFNRTIFELATKDLGYKTLKSVNRVIGQSGGISSTLFTGQMSENNYIVLESNFSLIGIESVGCCLDDFDLTNIRTIKTWKV